IYTSFYYFDYHIDINMKTTDRIVIGLGVVAGFIILYLLIKNNQNKHKSQMQEDKIADLERQISLQDSINAEIKHRLIELIHNDIEVEPSIANELSQILI